MTSPPSRQARLATATRGLRTALLVLVAVGLAGGTLGVLLERHVLLPRRIAEMRRNRGGPEMENFVTRMAQQLELTDSQRVVFDSILTRQVVGFRAIRSEMEPRIDSLNRETRSRIDSLLTSEQQAKYLEMSRQMRSRGGYPGGGGRRGGDGRGPGGPGGAGGAGETTGRSGGDTAGRSVGADRP
jgi:hypothetical protein